ncbi:hypothetical protein B0T16DRAFT_221752 [Cercophora newfieldiana]|uniref:Uncharacterized protein n=1 Tax=Cercophora newfieldiana TaxID=92897 RepID=A0AA39XYI4_9PEZI|nr:hypothetical protein B0T16DRAFT_221752 [Cercophora newfieldiana]
MPTSGSGSGSGAGSTISFLITLLLLILLRFLAYQSSPGIRISLCNNLWLSSRFGFRLLWDVPHRHLCVSRLLLLILSGNGKAPIIDFLLLKNY